MIETNQEEIESVKRIVEYGSKTSGKVTLTKELPFEVEIVEDPTMEVGKQETVQEGELGESQVTVTIENGKEVNREEEITRKPKKKIIKIGTKCNCDDITPNKPEDGKPGKDDDKPEGEKPNKPSDEDKPEKDKGDDKPSNENDRPEDDKPNKPKDNKTDKDDDKPEKDKSDDKPNKPSDSNRQKDTSTDSEKPSVEKTKNKNGNKPKKVTSKNESSDDKVKTGITGTLGIGATLMAALTAYKVSKKK